MDFQFVGYFIALGVVFYNFKVVKYGLSEVDITEDEILMKKVGLPASLLEIAFIIWAFSYLERRKLI